MQSEVENNHSVKDPLYHRVKLTQVAGKQVVFGLLWQPLERWPLPLVDLKERLQLFRADHYLLFPTARGEPELLGCLGGLVEAEKPYYSAAVLSRNQLGESCLALFELNARCFWMIGFHEGKLIPGTDILFEDSKEAWIRFQEARSLFPWKKLMVSPGFESDLERTRFADLSAQWVYSPEARLQFPGGHSWHKWLARRKYWLFAGGGIALGIGIGLWIRASRISTALQALKERQLAQLSFSRENAWRQSPDAQELLRISMEGLGNLPLQLYGGQLLGASYKAGVLKATYRLGNLVDWNRWSEEVKQRWEGCRVEQAQNTLQGLVFWDQPPLKNQLSTQPQPILPLHAALSQLIRTQKASGKVGAIASHTGTLKEFSFEFSSRINPKQLLETINLDGVVLSEASCSVDSKGKLQWKISGRCYGG